jgi:xylulokinase
MYLLGYDLGSSSVKAALLEVSTGNCIASSFYPEEEMPIIAKQQGWAEQDTEMWWENLQKANDKLFAKINIDRSLVKAIGISYQMHGLVLVDKEHKVLRPSIIWCDSRATGIGDAVFQHIGIDQCLESLLNSPGNFTASKLRWVKENEPLIFEKIHKFLLPGDFIAMKLTGELNTTISGLSEGIFWDFKKGQIADFLLDEYGIPKDMVPDIVSTFSNQGSLHTDAAKRLGLAVGTPVTYRAGDQPNNAFSLNVLQPGEVAATAGTSGVVYSVSDQVNYDPQSRVNTFAHVNHGAETRLGILLCINGCGILNAWMRKNTGVNSYLEMNNLASQVPVGSQGLSVLPFGNGAERVLENQNINAQINGLNFNIHGQRHLFRAAQEGIAFAIYYGMEVMKEMGVNLSVIRAAEANLFLSPIFRETLATISGSEIQLFNTDGGIGAARGAGLGAGIYSSPNEAFSQLKVLNKTTPNVKKEEAFKTAYAHWKNVLAKFKNNH